MIKKLAIIAAGTVLALSAFAADSTDVEQKIDLKDGITLYIFKDGKMGMKDQYGKAKPMEEGVVMETKSGEKIIMKGTDLWRLQAYVKPVGGHGGSR